jgi:hypothetical protein
MLLGIGQFKTVNQTKHLKWIVKLKNNIKMNPYCKKNFYE